jgi:hypothetical protein
MSFLDRFRAKWKHPDPAVRREAVARLRDQSQLLAIVEDDPDDSVRLAAVRNLSDEDALATIAEGNSPLAIPALERMTDRTLIGRVAQAAELQEVRELAVERIEDGITLHRIATSDTNARVRMKARSRRSGPDQMRDFIRTELAKLPSSPHPSVLASDVEGSLDEVCRALIADPRFRINGWLDQDVPGLATVRELNAASPATTPSAPTSSDRARFLAFKRSASGEPEEAARSNSFFEITVWRTSSDRYQCIVSEKTLRLVPDAAEWSRVSNATEHGADASASRHAARR